MVEVPETPDHLDQGDQGGMLAILRPQEFKASLGYTRPHQNNNKNDCVILCSTHSEGALS